MLNTRSGTHYILGIAIIFMGIVAIMRDEVISNGNGKYLGALFIVYGIWRLYRGFKAS